MLQVGKDGTQSGWYSDNGADLAHMISPHAVDWRTTNFQAGDIVVLGEASQLLCIRSRHSLACAQSTKQMSCIVSDTLLAVDCTWGVTRSKAEYVACNAIETHICLQDMVHLGLSMTN